MSTRDSYISSFFCLISWQREKDITTLLRLPFPFQKDEGVCSMRWAAIESIDSQIYTSFSDVWSYGVVIWEILTLGEVPYSTMDNRETIAYIRAGGRLYCPEGCPDRLYQLMWACWRPLPYRPNFTWCLQWIGALQNIFASVER